MSARLSRPDANRKMMSPEPARNFRAVIRRFHQGWGTVMVGLKFLLYFLTKLESCYFSLILPANFQEFPFLKIIPLKKTTKNHFCHYIIDQYNHPASPDGHLKIPQSLGSRTLYQLLLFPFQRKPFRGFFEPTAVSLKFQQVSPMQQAVKDSRGSGIVAQQVAPVFKGSV